MGTTRMPCRRRRVDTTSAANAASSLLISTNSSKSYLLKMKIRTHTTTLLPTLLLVTGGVVDVKTEEVSRTHSIRSIQQIPQPQQFSQQQSQNPPPITPSQRQCDSVSLFLQDLKKLNGLHGQFPILSPTHANYDSTYTKSWTDVDWEKHQERSLLRYKRHMVSWLVSPTAKAVIPSVAVVVLWSVVVQLLHQKIGMLQEVISKSSLSYVSAFTAPIGLLLALRTNRALNRLLEARSMFGKIIRITQSLAGLGCSYLSNDDDDDGNNDAILMGRYLAIYGWAIKGCLRKESTEEVCRNMLPPSEAHWMRDTPADAPTSIVFRIRQLIRNSDNPIPMEISGAIERYLSELESSLGVCKRLLASPIPPTFSRHTSRALCLYLGLLPVALVASGSSLTSIIITATLLSYVLIGIDEIALETENPFPLMPMFSLACTGQRNVENQLRMMDMTP